LEYFENIHPVAQALLATLFTWGMTALGSAVVYLKSDFLRKILDMMYGFAAGVMMMLDVGFGP
jgi:ZIP family zinc transporter